MVRKRRQAASQSEAPCNDITLRKCKYLIATGQSNGGGWPYLCEYNIEGCGQCDQCDPYYEEDQVVANEEDEREEGGVETTDSGQHDETNNEDMKKKCTAGVIRFGKVTAQTLSPADVGNDPLFPPELESIGTGSCGDTTVSAEDSQPCTKYNHWKTFEEVANKRGFKLAKSVDGTLPVVKVFDKAGPQIIDIKQGSIGNCYFLAAVASLANSHPELIKAMFVDTHLWVQNIFKTRWLINGKETYTYVDNMIPASPLQSILYFQEPGLRGAFWPVILEKAWAKILGSYEAIDTGDAGVMLAALTGAPMKKYFHDEVDSGMEDELWQVLLRSVDAKYPMTSASKPTAWKSGLLDGHAYALLDAYESPKYGRVVKLFNPHREHDYKGAVPNIVEKHAVKGKTVDTPVGPITLKRERGKYGVFTITFLEYVESFEVTNINKVVSGYVIVSKTIPLGKEVAMKVEVPHPGHFFAEIIWPMYQMVDFDCPLYPKIPPSFVAGVEEGGGGKASHRLHAYTDYDYSTKFHTYWKNNIWATAKAEKFEDLGDKYRKEAEKIEANLANVNKKYTAMESSYDVALEDLFNATIKLEEKEKVAANAEADVGASSRRILLMEDDADKSENRLAVAISGLLRASLRADEQIKARTQLLQDISTNEEDIDELENTLKEAKTVLLESERKYEDIARKHTNLESEAIRSNERADLEEKKIQELEEELKVVGNNLQQLEVSEEKAMAREENYQKQLHELMVRLKAAETEAENSEMNIQRLNIRIDQIEDELIHEKLKIKKISDDVDGTFKQMESGVVVV